MGLIDILNFIYEHLENPKALYLLIPLTILLTWSIGKDFIKVSKKPKHHKLILITRILTLVFLLIAIAGPYSNETHYIKGNPRIKILLDESKSFSLFNKDETENFIKKVEKQISVETQTIAFEDSSPLGDGILNNLKEYENLLLITDGHSNFGTDLNEVSVYAESINATISSIKIEPKIYDASISIKGPSKTTANVENTFTVNLDQSRKPRPLNVRITVDEIEIYNQPTEESFTFTKTFSNGYHKIEAKLLGQEDHFNENNIFYKTIKVVPKPKVLFYSEKPSDLFTLLSPMYELETLPYIPENLEDYTGIIINDIPASSLKSKIPELTNFIAEGNGMVVVGGPNSYDMGDYKGSMLEQMLPVYVAQAGKKQGNINIVVLIDISRSTGKQFGGDKVVDVEKALTMDILKDIHVINKVGVAAFNTESYVIGEMMSLNDHTELTERISKLKDIGGTRIFIGMAKAIEMLQNQAGSKNIIVITDGRTEGYDETLSATHQAAEKGIRTFTVGIGKQTNRKLLELMAEIGNGAYFEPAEKEGLKILFGDPKTSKRKDHTPKMSVINSNHFITKDLDLSASVFGYNTVVPKTSAKLLVSTDTGDPLITAWRYGLGRVASFTTDDGSLFAPETMNKANSKIWTRTVNWAIGDPERKQNTYINIEDSRIGEAALINIKSSKLPASEEISFSMLEEEIYQGSFVPEETGFHKKFSAEYAINGIKELDRIGFNKELLEDTALITGGRMFEKNEIKEIVSFVKTKSRRQVFGKKSKTWIFVILAVITFLTEVCFRRIKKNQALNDKIKLKFDTTKSKFKRR